MTGPEQPLKQEIVATIERLTPAVTLLAKIYGEHLEISGFGFLNKIVIQTLEEWQREDDPWPRAFSHNGEACYVRQTKTIGINLSALEKPRPTKMPLFCNPTLIRIAEILIHEGIVHANATPCPLPSKENEYVLDMMKIVCEEEERTDLLEHLARPDIAVDASGASFVFRAKGGDGNDLFVQFPCMINEAATICLTGELISPLLSNLAQISPEQALRSYWAQVVPSRITPPEFVATMKFLGARKDEFAQAYFSGQFFSVFFFNHLFDENIPQDTRRLMKKRLVAVLRGIADDDVGGFFKALGKIN